MALASSRCRRFLSKEATRLKFPKLSMGSGNSPRLIIQWLWVQWIKALIKAYFSMGSKPGEERGLPRSIGEGLG